VNVEDEFESLIAPYVRAAEELGYRRLQRRVSRGSEDDAKNLWSCSAFYFDDDATFLDLNAGIKRGHVPRKYLTGFNGVQFYTFIIDGLKEDWVITNGSPPLPRPPLTMIPFLPLIRWVEKLVPEHLQPLTITSADDLPRVLERHHLALAARGGTIRKPQSKKPLEERWAWSEMFNE